MTDLDKAQELAEQQRKEVADTILSLIADVEHTRSTLLNVTANLMAATSAYEAYGGKADPFFTTRYEDYQRAIQRGREALYPPAPEAEREKALKDLADLGQAFDAAPEEE